MAALDFSQFASQPSFGERYAQGQQQALQNKLTEQQNQMQMRSAQNQNALAQYQILSAQRENASTNALNTAYQNAYDLATGKIDSARLLQSLASSGAGSKIPGVQKSLTDAEIAQLNRQKLQGEVNAQPGDAAYKAAQTGDLNEKTLDLQLSNFNKRFSPLSVNGPDDVRAYTVAMYNDPKLGPLATRMKSLDEALQANLAEFARDPNMWKVAHSNVSGKDIFEALKGTRRDVNLGNVSRGSTVNAFGNVVPGSQVDTSIGATPSTDAAMMQARAAQGQLGVAQDRLAKEGQGVTYIQDAAGGYTAVPNRLAPGVAPVPRPVLTAEGVPLKAKLSPFAERQAAAKVQLQKDLTFAITEIGDAIKKGGLIDQSTGSGAGRLADISMGFVGQATPGAIAIGKLQPIADLPLKLVPRFEGPQSNADLKTYQQASAQLADPTLPRDIRKAAGATIVRLMTERQSQFATKDMAPTVENAAKAMPAPTGVDPALWNAMTPEEQKLWKK